LPVLHIIGQIIEQIIWQIIWRIIGLILREIYAIQVEIDCDWSYAVLYDSDTLI
jgi:hypothetical protein